MPPKTKPPSSNQNASAAADMQALYCPRCGGSHDLKQCKKQIDLLNRSPEEIKQLEPKRKESKYPAEGWVGYTQAECCFKETDFRNWVLSETGRVERQQTNRPPGDEHKGYLFRQEPQDLGKLLNPSDKCLRCGQADHVWPTCTTRVSLKQAQDPQAWPSESTEGRFHRERDFKLLIECAIEPKKHSQFLLNDDEGSFQEHFESKLTLPEKADLQLQLNHNAHLVDNRAELGHQMVSSADMAAVPSRPSFAEIQGGKKVLTNHFIVDLPDNLKLFKYVLAGQRDATSARGKRKEEMERFISESPTLSSCRNDFATDEISLIVSWKNLYPNSPNPVPDTLMETRTFRNAKRPEADKRLDLIFGGCVDINALKTHVQLPKAFGENFQPAIQALNMLLLKGAAENAEKRFETFRIGNNRVFRKSGYEPMVTKLPGSSLCSLLVCHRGYFSTITPGLGNALLNLNIAHSVFFRPMPLNEFLKFAKGYFGLQRDSEVGRLLRGVRVWIAYDHSYDRRTPKGSIKKHQNPSLRIKTIRGLGLPLGQQTFLKGGEPTTVADYLRKEYPGSDAHLHQGMSSVNLGTEISPLWYDPHTLHILPYQPFRPKLSADLQSKMITIACKPPEDSKAAIINEGLRCMALPPPNQGFLARVGISIRPNLMMVPCREITTPTIMHRSQTGLPIQAKMTYSIWNMIERKHLFTPSNASIAPVFYIHPWTETEINRFHENFMGHVRGYLSIQTGGFAHQAFTSDNFTEDYFRKALTKADSPATKAKLVVFIACKGKGYEEFKQAADQVKGIQSICLRTDKLHKKYPENNNQWSNYVGNVSMKLNLKVGGVNHEVKNLGRICKAVEGELPVMILGADVTHPSPGTVDGFPSIAALVGSTDRTFGRYGGSMRIQYPEENKKARETIKSHLMESMVGERLEAYRNNNRGRYPDKILYYRDGVGEGQYTQLKEIEISAIRDAFRAVCSKPVKITAVVTTKRHHTRLYPGNNTTCKQVQHKSWPANIGPGTTVESSIVSPDKFDFFLVSHVGIKGTSRPTYYTVIENEMNFDARGIQDFTNALCYTYVRATMSVSYAPPAYYADRLCERGRVYLRRFFDPSYPADDLERMKNDIRQAWGGTENANPWHKNLNDTMFWM